MCRPPWSIAGTREHMSRRRTYLVSNSSQSLGYKGCLQVRGLSQFQEIPSATRFGCCLVSGIPRTSLSIEKLSKLKAASLYLIMSIPPKSIRFLQAQSSTEWKMLWLGLIVSLEVLYSSLNRCLWKEKYQGPFPNHKDYGFIVIVTKRFHLQIITCISQSIPQVQLCLKIRITL